MTKTFEKDSIVEEAQAAITTGPDGRMKFPTICVCLECGGVTGAVGNDLEYSAEVGLTIALIQHGYYLKCWEGENVANADIYPHRCTCKCKHKWEETEASHWGHVVVCTKCRIKRVVDSSD
jgi:hypothetical protein